MYGNNIIERVEKFKYFGIIFDTLLAWSTSEHVNYISFVISKRIGVIVLWSWHILIIVVQFGLTASLNSVILFNFLKTNLAVFFLSADIYTPILNMMNILHWDKLCEE